MREGTSARHRLVEPVPRSDVGDRKAGEKAVDQQRHEVVVCRTKEREKQGL